MKSLLNPSVTLPVAKIGLVTLVSYDLHAAVFIEFIDEYGNYNLYFGDFLPNDHSVEDASKSSIGLLANSFFSFKKASVRYKHFQCHVDDNFIFQRKAPTIHWQGLYARKVYDFDTQNSQLKEIATFIAQHRFLQQISWPVEKGHIAAMVNALSKESNLKRFINPLVFNCMDMAQVLLQEGGITFVKPLGGYREDDTVWTGLMDFAAQKVPIGDYFYPKNWENASVPRKKEEEGCVIS